MVCEYIPGVATTLAHVTWVARAKMAVRNNRKPWLHSLGHWEVLLPYVSLTIKDMADAYLRPQVRLQKLVWLATPAIYPEQKKMIKDECITML